MTAGTNLRHNHHDVAFGCAVLIGRAISRKELDDDVPITSPIVHHQFLLYPLLTPHISLERNPALSQSHIFLEEACPKGPLSFDLRLSGTTKSDRSCGRKDEHETEKDFYKHDRQNNATNGTADSLLPAECVNAPYCRAQAFLPYSSHPTKDIIGTSEYSFTGTRSPSRHG